MTMVTVNDEMRARPTAASTTNNQGPWTARINGVKRLAATREPTRKGLWPKRSARMEPMMVPAAPPRRKVETNFPEYMGSPLR